MNLIQIKIKNVFRKKWEKGGFVFGGFTCCSVYSKTTYVYKHTHTLIIHGIKGHLTVIMSIFISVRVELILTATFECFFAVEVFTHPLRHEDSVSPTPCSQHVRISVQRARGVPHRIQNSPEHPAQVPVMNNNIVIHPNTPGQLSQQTQSWLSVS